MIGGNFTKHDPSIRDLCLAGGYEKVTDDALGNGALCVEVVNDGRHKQILVRINQGIHCQEDRPEAKDTVSTVEATSTFFRSNTNHLPLDHDTITESESVGIQTS